MNLDGEHEHDLQERDTKMMVVLMGSKGAGSSENGSGTSSARKLAMANALWVRARTLLARRGASRECNTSGVIVTN
jgi:hypothetical protein